MELAASELAQLSSRLRVPVAGALKYSGTAQIAELPTMHSAMCNAFLQRGGQMLARQLSVMEAERLAEQVVIAAGVHSARLLQPLGHTVPLIAERGYHITQPKADWPESMPPIHFEDRSLVLTRFRTGLRATSFVEFSTPEAPADARKWARLREHVGELGLPFNGEATEWMGSRPTLPDYLPAIGRSQKRSNVLYAFGHQHLGLTLAALTGELISALACGDPPDANLTPFSLERFRSFWHSAQMGDEASTIRDK